MVADHVKEWQLAGPNAIINSLPSDWLNNKPTPLSIMCVHLPQSAYLKNAL